MKYLFFFVFSAISMSLVAQQAYSMLEAGVSWVNELATSSGEDTDTTLLVGYLPAGDSIVNDTVYRVFRTEGTYQRTSDDSVVSAVGYRLLREEENRLFGRVGGKDALLMDFSLMHGDTFRAGNNERIFADSRSYMVVTEIDSIALLDGSLRKRIKLEIYGAGFDGIPYAVNWIDGLGSTNSLFFPWRCGAYWGGGRSVSLVCYHRLICAKDAENRLLFNDSEQEIYDCNQEGVVSRNRIYQLPEEAFDVFPNPSADFITVEANDRYQIARTVLTDMTGRIVSECSFVTPARLPGRIDVRALPAGIYGLSVFTTAGERAALRVVIR